MILGGVVFVMVLGFGIYVKYLNDTVVECKALKAIEKITNEERVKHYNTIIEDIVVYYEERADKVDSFKKDKNETDCQASKRFFDGFSY